MEVGLPPPAPAALGDRGGGLKEKNKEWQMEMLMEKIRSKSSQYKSFFETSKVLRMTMLEKRFPIDAVERAQLQKCLDTLQQNIKVTTHQAMIERLDSVSRQLGLKFVTGPSGLDLFISSDMFYLEVVLEGNGGVKDVKIHHDGRGEQQSCEELVSCLTRRDFADLTAQLEGLTSIYQLNAEKKVKCKAFSALTSLEVDLTTLSSMYTGGGGPIEATRRCPVGYLEKRRGGHPMRLTYFVSPYELLTENPKDKGPCLSIGSYASVCMESSSAQKLQTSPIVNLTNGPDGQPWPVYASLGPSNSISVAGSFVLNLNKPIPICTTLVNSIHQVTQVPCVDLSTTCPLLDLICQNAANGHELSLNKGLFVNVGDQHHCYLMTECRGLLDGVIVSSIPFTHPSHVPEILALLKQQALFNCVIASCVRPNTKSDLERMVMVEVTPLSWRRLSISIEHPIEENMASVELDLTDIDSVKVNVFTSSISIGQTSDTATKVFQRCLSIPVTMRSLIKEWTQQAGHLYNGGGFGGGSGGSGGAGAGGGDASSGGGGGGVHGGPVDLLDSSDVKIKLEPGLGGGGGYPSLSEPEHTMDLTIGPSSMSGVQFSEMETKALLSGLMEQTQSKTKRKKKSGEGWQSDDSSSSDEGREISEISAELDLEQVLSSPPAKKPKKREKEKTPSEILFDLENKNLVPPSVSITPISSSQITQNLSSVLSGMGLERRPGIEIIPISSSAPAPMPSSITITPISSKAIEERSKERKSSRSKEEKIKYEKKRKRKREDSMGPPEKLPPKSDPLSKPVSVSIKPAESNSPRPSSPAGTMRKYTSSPTHSPLAMGKGSPSGKSKSHHSPKHSPASYSTSSPKNSLTSSPKGGTSSPKHGSSSGKPSLSALKAVSSPSKEGKSKSKDRDKDRKTLGNSSVTSSSSPKLKSSSVKLKQLDLSSLDVPQSLQSGGAVPLPVGDPGKSSASCSGQPKNRKGLLINIIDKLKSAQSCSDGPDQGTTSKEKKDKLSSSSSSKVDVKPGEKPAGEYMVKHSSDGMKITINKTKKEKVRSSGSSSPTIKKTGQKRESWPPSSSKTSGWKPPRPPTSKTGTGLSNDAGKRPRPSQITSGALTVTPSVKPEKKPGEEALLFVDGFTKTLDTNFQIPKLSARSSGGSGGGGDSKKSTPPPPPPGISITSQSATPPPTLSLSEPSPQKTSTPPPAVPVVEMPPPPPSPSVSVHIVPSRCMSPTSPCMNASLTDDELMDEALVGLGK